MKAPSYTFSLVCSILLIVLATVLIVVAAEVIIKVIAAIVAIGALVWLWGSFTSNRRTRQGTTV